MNPNRKRILEITTTGLFMAIIIVMTFIPNLGYIQINVLSITTLHIPVIVGSVLLGPVGGLILGATWGITNWINALQYPIEGVIFMNPLISVVPRIIVGLVVGFGSVWPVLKTDSKNKIARFFANTHVRDVTLAIVGTMTNTVLVLSAIGLFASTIAWPFSQTFTVIVQVVLSLNGSVELISAIVIVPIVLAALRRIRK
jgi:uncharacterized membrane protein